MINCFQVCFNFAFKFDLRCYILELTRVNNSGSTTLPTQLYDILKSCQLARPGYHSTRSI